MDNPPRRAPGRFPRLAVRWPGGVCAALAAVSGVLVLIGAAVLPVESVLTGRPGVQPRVSLLHANGALILLPASVPLLTAIAVSALLGLGRPGRHGWLPGACWVLSAGLLAAALAGTVTFLIPVFAVPTGALLVAATAQARRPVSPGPPRAGAAARTGSGPPPR